MVNEHPLNVRAAAHIAVAINMDRICSSPFENWVRSFGGNFSMMQESPYSRRFNYIDDTPLSHQIRNVAPDVRLNRPLRDDETKFILVGNRHYKAEN